LSEKELSKEERFKEEIEKEKALRKELEKDRKPKEVKRNE
jgi:hypothetical protein